MTVRVSTVDVGQGDCTVAVDSDTGAGILIDCPEGRHAAAISELDRLGLRELRLALVTHTHLDHFGGVLDVIECLADRFTGILLFNQDSLMVRPLAGEERAVEGKKLRALVTRAGELGPNRVARSEVPFPPGEVGGLRWRLLAPTYYEVVQALKGADPNLASGVVVLGAAEDSFVVGGDAPLATWERIAQDVPTNAVVRWPHHGGSLGPDPDAQAKVREILQPSHILVSVGASNTHGHPTQQFFDAVGGGPYGHLFCTQSTTSCAAKPDVCAGTVRVELGDHGGPQLSPDNENHQEHVGQLSCARCLADEPPHEL